MNGTADNDTGETGTAAAAPLIKLCDIDAAFEMAECGSAEEERLGQLCDWRDQLLDFRDMRDEIDEDGASATVVGTDGTSNWAVRPEVLPAFRAVVEQQIALLEADLKRGGVELDDADPPTLPDGTVDAIADGVQS